MPPPLAQRVPRYVPRSLFGMLGGAAILGALVACTPKIGDKCQVSTDCSVRGDRLCDISQPQGYCTQLNCQGGSCPADEGSCVLFGSAVPGCSYDDRSGPFGSRVARSFCMSNCTSNGDCRAGYVCADPRTAPWNAVILDDDQAKRSCLPIASETADGGDAGDAGAGVMTTAAPVCGPAAPPMTPIDAGPAVIHDGGIDVPPLFPTSSSVGPADASRD